MTGLQGSKNIKNKSFLKSRKPILQLVTYFCCKLKAEITLKILEKMWRKQNLHSGHLYV